MEVQLRVVLIRAVNLHFEYSLNLKYKSTFECKNFARQISGARNAMTMYVPLLFNVFVSYPEFKKIKSFGVMLFTSKLKPSRSD